MLKERRKNAMNDHDDIRVTNIAYLILGMLILASVYLTFK